VYDAMSEAHEFIGRDRAEALTKATSFFGVGEDELAIAEVDATRASGIGTRFVLVAYQRSAGPPGRHAGGEGGYEGGREREGRRDRGRGRGGDEERGRGRRTSERGERGGRGERRERGGRERDRDRDRDRGGERSEARERSERPERAGREAEAAEPSKGKASTALGEMATFVCGLVERMGLGPFEISESGENQEPIVVSLTGKAAERLSGGDGRVADAIQLLANQASMRAGGEEARRVVIEVEGNADQREAFLSKIADRAAQRARETGRPVALEAMSPRDRRSVHLALREVDGIATMSVGDGRYRQVVVVPDSAPEYQEALRYESDALRERD